MAIHTRIVYSNYAPSRESFYIVDAYNLKTILGSGAIISGVYMYMYIYVHLCQPISGVLPIDVHLSM